MELVFTKTEIKNMTAFGKTTTFKGSAKLIGKTALYRERDIFHTPETISSGNGIMTSGI
jgi:hypothetical protein